MLTPSGEASIVYGVLLCSLHQEELRQGMPLTRMGRPHAADPLKLLPIRHKPGNVVLMYRYLYFERGNTRIQVLVQTLDNTLPIPPGP